MSSKIGSKRLISKGQIRAGRAFLGWSQRDLSTISGVSLNTVKRIEKGEGRIKARFQTVEDLTEAFMRYGVIFESDAGKIGVALLQDIQQVIMTE
jgi:transcriptional regulator with XRE-family HTH domain